MMSIRKMKTNHEVQEKRLKEYEELFIIHNLLTLNYINYNKTLVIYLSKKMQVENEKGYWADILETIESIKLNKDDEVDESYIKVNEKVRQLNTVIST